MSNSWSNGWDNSFWGNAGGGWSTQQSGAQPVTPPAPTLLSSDPTAGNPAVTITTAADPQTVAVTPPVLSIPVAAATTDPASSTIVTAPSDGSAAMVVAPPTAVVSPAATVAVAPSVDSTVSALVASAPDYTQFFVGVAIGFGLCWLFSGKSRGPSAAQSIGAIV